MAFRRACLATFSSSVLYSGLPYNGAAIPDGVGFYPNNTTQVNFNRPQDDGTRINYVTNRIKFNADAFTVTNVVGYLYSNEFEGGDIDGSSLDLFYEQESIKRTSLSEELRFQSVPAERSIGPAGFITATTAAIRRNTRSRAPTIRLGCPTAFRSLRRCPIRRM